MRWLGMLGALLAAAWPVVGAAQGAFELERLRRLVQEGRMEAAYAYASEHRSDQEGQPRFDLYYGVAAIDAGHVPEGVFALERVLMLQPGHDRARLELARGYYLLGQDRRARDEFRAVLAHDPPPAMQATAEQYLRAIRNRAPHFRTTVRGRAEAGVGYDSNVNSGPDTDEVAIDAETYGVDSYPLSQDSRATSDLFLFGQGSVRAGRALTRSWGLYGEADARSRIHGSENRLDQLGAGFNAGVRHRGERHQVRLGLRARRLDVGGDHYQSQRGVQSDAGYQISRLTQVSGFAQAVKLEYPGTQTRDSLMGVIGAGASHRFLGDWYVPTVSGSGYWGGEQADQDSAFAEAIAERDFLGLSTTLRFRVHPEVMARINGGYRYSRYGAEQDPFGKRRREAQYTLGVSADWRYRSDVILLGAIDFRRNESNIGLYDYDRLQIRTGARYDFY